MLEVIAIQLLFVYGNAVEVLAERWVDSAILLYASSYARENGCCFNDQLTRSRLDVSVCSDPAHLHMNDPASLVP